MSTAIVLFGCGAAHEAPERLPAAIGVGHGPHFRPSSLSGAAARGKPIRRLRCERTTTHRFGVHLELFAEAQVVLVSPGIGIAPPRRSTGAYVTGGRCAYATITREPTGVIEVIGGARRTLGDFFSVWGQPLSTRRLAGFRGRVRVYVAGRRVRGDPGSIELAKHAEIVIEVGPLIAPHASYRFAPGL